MKYKILLIFVASHFFFVTEGQISMNADSLRQAHQLNPDDLHLLNELALSYGFSDPDSALYYARLLIDRSGDNASMSARGYNAAANAYLTQNKLDKAEGYYKKAIDICETHHLDYEAAVYKRSLGQLFLNYGNSGEALKYFQESVQYFQENPESKQADFQLALNYSGIGNTYTLIGLYNLALENLFEALDYSKKIKDQVSVAINYNNIASVYHSLKEHKKSIEYNQKGLQEFQDFSYPLGEATVLLNMAQDYFELGKIDTCISLLNQSDSILLSVNTTYNLGEVYSLFGEVYRSEGDYTTSTDYLQKAIEIHSASGAMRYLGVALLNLSRNQNDVGEFVESEKNFQKSYKIFNENDYPKEKMEALDYWLTVQFSEDKITRDYFDEFKNARISYLDDEKQKSITAQEILQQTNEKEILIATQELRLAKETNRRNQALGGGLLIAFVSLGGVYWMRFRQKKNELENQKRLTELQQNMNRMQIDGLNLRLNPHEFKNLLAGISPEIQEKAPDAYRKMLKLLRITQAGLNNQSLTESLSDQIEQTHDYLSLMKHSLSEPLTFSLDNDLEGSDILIPRLLLKNLAENAVKHGIRGKEDGGHISIRITGHTDAIQIEVDDTGKGRSDKVPKESGIGISTYRNLFEILNVKNSHPASLKIVDKSQGTKVVVTIPKKYKYE